MSSALPLTIANPDIYNSAWSTSPRLQQIALMYRMAGTQSWFTATNGVTPVTFPTAVAAVCGQGRNISSVD